MQHEIAGILEPILAEGRRQLLEHECYRLFTAAGLPAPRWRLVGPGGDVTADDLEHVGSERVVLKIASPDIVHKTDVGGVRIVAAELDTVRAAVAAMLREAPSAHVERHPGTAPPDVRGVLLCEFVQPDARGLASELFVGVRDSEEFGPVLTAGVGGVEMEALAAGSRRGVAVAMAPTGLVDGVRFAELFAGTLSHRRLTGRLRGAERLLDDDALAACFDAFVRLAEALAAPGLPYRLAELEVNPFVVAGGRLVPLDGVCALAAPREEAPPRPLAKIGNLLRPGSAAVVGVSERSMNMGRIILNNLFAAGFPRERAWVVRPGVDEIDGARCVPSIADLPEKVDLFVVAVGAAQVPEIVTALIDHDRANGVILIPGGLGEKEGSQDLERQLKARIRAAHGSGDGGPVFLGGNSLGVISHPGHYDTMFIPDAKLPKARGERRRKACFISQSGAFIIANLSRVPGIDPAYALSIGNQLDLTAGDLLSYLKDDPELEVFALYMEGFQPGDGLRTARAVRAAVAAGKDVIAYKAGRTSEGRSATAGHTASVAGDYAVCEAALEEAGALVAADFAELGDLTRLCLALRGRRRGGLRLAAMSNAGFESVGMADSLRGEDGALELVRFGPDTVAAAREALARHRLDGLVDVKNPLDVTPMAGDEAFAELAALLLADPGVDAMVAGIVPLTPALQTLPASAGVGESLEDEGSIAVRLPRLAAAQDKPVVAVVDSGVLFDPLAAALEAGGLPVLRNADRAVRLLRRVLVADARREEAR